MDMVVPCGVSLVGLAYLSWRWGVVVVAYLERRGALRTPPQAQAQGGRDGV